MAFVPNTFSIPFVSEEPPDQPAPDPVRRAVLALAPLPPEDRPRPGPSADLERVAVLGEN